MIDSMGMRGRIVTLAAAVAAIVTVGAGFARAQSDAEIRAAIAKAGDAKDNPGAAFCAVFEHTDVTVEESGLAHFRRHDLVKILTDEGAVERATLRFDYDPASNSVAVERIRVFRKEGTVENVDLAGLRDLFAPASMIYWGARMKVIGLPRLDVGDAVEVESVKKGFEIAYLDGPDTTSSLDESRYVPPMRGHFYDVVIFQDNYPIKEKRYALHMPKDKPIQYEVYNGTLASALTFDDKGTHYSWWREDIPPFKHEPRSASPSDVSTKLVLATVPSWQEKSRWFAAIHDTIYYDNPAIKAKVRELTSGLSTDVEKVAALQHWAAQEIRYSGISMGKGEGYTHHPGKMSFADRCGVCKDKAGMLITLLRSAGYEAWPALTFAGARVEEIPADQFNHSVVAWRHKDGTYTMLDPTWVPYSTELWSSAEQEQNYIIGTPWGEGLMETPYSPPEKHVLKIVSRGEVNAAGDLAGTMRITATNYMDQRLRRMVGTHKKDDLVAYIESWLAAVSPQVELVKYTAGDPLDFVHEYAVDIQYRVPRYAVAAEGGVDFASPAWKLGFGAPGLLMVASLIGPEKRENPLFFMYTQSLECDESIRLPGGLEARELEKKSAGAGEYASYTMERALAGPVLENKGTVLVKHRMVPAASYAEFRSTLKAADDYGTARVIFER
jgi:hypothetical protein